jgi:monoterpene epsilon-lactone hydrolase
MPSPQAEQIHALMGQVKASLDAVPTLEQQRAGGEMFGALTAPPTGVTSTEVDAGRVPALWQTPEGAKTDRVILYLHGGGYVACSMRSHESLVGHLAKAAGTRALNINYRLAPENPFPAALDDSIAAYHWLLSQGIEPRHIAVVGDSAGGGLTLATLLRLRDERQPLPGAAVAMSAYADATCSGATYASQADIDLLVSVESAQVAWDFYGGDPKDPLVSPVFGDYAGLPPLLLHVGASECLLDDSRRVEAAAAAAGVDVTLSIWPDMQHVFQVAAGNTPEADEAVAEIGAFIKARLA